MLNTPSYNSRTQYARKQTTLRTTVPGQYLPVVTVSDLMVTTTGVGVVDAGGRSDASLTIAITFCKKHHSDYI